MDIMLMDKARALARSQVAMQMIAEEWTVSLIETCDEILTCDFCGRNENSLQYDKPAAPLLDMYLIESDSSRPGYENYICADCIDPFIGFSIDEYVTWGW